MGGEAIPFIFVQAVEPSHVLRKSDGFENSHILSAGENICPVDHSVDPDHAPDHELPLIKLAVCQLCRKRAYKIPPYEGFVGDFRNLSGRDLGKIDYIEMTIKEIFTLLFCGTVVVKHVECVIILVFGIYAVTRKTAPKAVGPFMHDGNGVDDLLSGKTLAGF